MRPNSSRPGTTGAADRVQLVTSGEDGLPGPLIALNGGSPRPKGPGGDAQDWRTRSLLMLYHSGEVERRMDGASEHPPKVPDPISKA